MTNIFCTRFSFLFFVALASLEPPFVLAQGMLAIGNQYVNLSLEAKESKSLLDTKKRLKGTLGINIVEGDLGLNANCSTEFKSQYKKQSSFLLASLTGTCSIFLRIGDFQWHSSGEGFTFTYRGFVKNYDLKDSEFVLESWNYSSLLYQGQTVYLAEVKNKVGCRFREWDSHSAPTIFLADYQASVILLQDIPEEKSAWVKLWVPADGGKFVYISSELLGIKETISVEIDQ